MIRCPSGLGDEPWHYPFGGIWRIGLDMPITQRSLMKNDMKTYLGDGVYVALDPLGIVLTTENGVMITNTIVLEPEVWRALDTFMKRLRAQEVGYEE